MLISSLTTQNPYLFRSVFDAANGVTTDSQRSQNGVTTESERRHTRGKTGLKRFHTVNLSKKPTRFIVRFIYAYLIYTQCSADLFNIWYIFISKRNICYYFSPFENSCYHSPTGTTRIFVNIWNIKKTFKEYAYQETEE